MSFFRYNFFFALLLMTLAVMSVSGVAWLFFETYQERAAVSGLAFAYDAALSKSSYASTVRALLHDTETERTELNAFVQNHDPVEVIRMLEDIGAVAKVAVTVDAVSSGGSFSVDPTLSTFLVTVSAYGPFDKLNHFVTLLSTLPIPSRLEQIRLEQQEKEWHVVATVRIFVEGKL